MRNLAPLVAAGLVAAVISVASVEAAQRLVIPRNSVGTQQIRDGTIQRQDLNRATVQWLNAGAPTPRGRGVTVTAGKNGDRIRVTGANLRGGDVLGQMELLGPMSCPNLGPWLRVDATFFDANGTVIDTGGDTQTEPAPGVRYPLNAIGATAAVRAEAVASVECI